MPEFIVVRCYSCEHYQVTQRRADSKFTCKICGSRQSVRTIPARSHNAAQLRPLVQQANMARGDAQNIFDQLQQPPSEPDSDRESNPEQEKQSVPTSSRWTTFVRALKTENFTSPGEKATPDDNSDPEVVTSLPDRQKKRRRKGTVHQAASDVKTPSASINESDALSGTNTFKSASVQNCEIFETQEFRHGVLSSEDLQSSGNTNVNLSDTVEYGSNTYNDGWGSQWGRDGEEAWN